jgi:tetratricopeptide (TPR) repeat protein
MSGAVASLVVLALVPAIAFGQKDKDQKEPKRPELYARADTNDAAVYYNFGIEQLERNPKVAADALYWATRLNPLHAEAYYARRVALLLSNRRRAAQYYEGHPSTLKAKDIQRIDSLYLTALTLNPFLYERLDRLIYQAAVDDFVQSQTGYDAGALRYAIDRMMYSGGPSSRAWAAYTEGRFGDALKYYADAIKESRAKYKYLYRSRRGRLFFQLNQPDSALAELTLAVEDLRKADARDFVYLYVSKALFEQTVGMALERLDRNDAAKEAYGRALQEDLAYSPAHIRLAYLALQAKDTATALSEFDLAVQLRPDDVGLLYQYGYALMISNRLDDAAGALTKAIQGNPLYALPRYALAVVYEQQGNAADALREYQTFTTLSSRQDARLTDAMERIKALAPK